MELQKTIKNNAIAAVIVVVFAQVLFLALPLIPTMGVTKFVLAALIVFAVEMYQDLK